MIVFQHELSLIIHEFFINYSSFAHPYGMYWIVYVFVLPNVNPYGIVSITLFVD